MGDGAEPVAPAPIELVDLQAQRRRLGSRIDRAIARVLDHARFVLGPEVDELERRLSAYCGARHAVTCSSGTDALLLALMALEVGPGDAVVVPSFTFAATAEVVALAGAVPVFADVDPDTFTLDPDSVEAALAAPAGDASRVVGVVAVDLYGQPADYGALREVAAGAGAWVVADAAQSFGATLDGRRVGTLAPLTATSFFPAKPLGAYGDGGALFTDDDDLAGRLRSVRAHGAGAGEKYDHVRLGLNARLDTLQAAVLLEKLAVFDDEVAARQAVAERYREALSPLGRRVELPVVAAGATSVWSSYTVRLGRRDEVAADLRSQGVASAVHYPRPLHRQAAFQAFPTAPGGAPVSERLAATVLSLPMHAYLSERDQRTVTAAVAGAVS